ncbi:MAG: hypothetical protein CL814_15015 [Confluentimicrobium sp.]|jgi:hypothetical protein|uniref:hypothetical protein n=1 Tax=Actibacterium sp. TaxID=1872125 RepID=UPI00050FB581|nr:hypothetical protein [Actibacterium sp.]KGB81109.1 hypothetical protein JT55_15015 [Rhodovulum sp. NI22]MBC58224.1 hypothetical protein [Actibacterium sp.]MDY6858146.1 hypothetical protein [Pseudomonadota bacterium]|tara:strand:- start:3389 stop:3778 length:390 start_codon:yes stop_codon:yes gene_type:complete
MRRLALLLLLPLAACATPRERCDRAATEDLRVVGALIVETEQNIARGYAIQQEVRERPRLTYCWGGRGGDGHFGYAFCNDTETYTVDRPVAIDLDEERAKLATLKRKYAELKKRSALDLAACAVNYPET